MIGIRSSRAAIVTLSLPAAVLALMLTPTAGRAEQFVLFDVTDKPKESTARVSGAK